MGDAGPQRISHYAIIRLLNEGPISYTYLGKDEQRKKRYVILSTLKRAPFSNNLPLAKVLRQTKSSHFSPPSPILYNMHMSHTFCTATSIPAIYFSVSVYELLISRPCLKSCFNHLTI